MKPIALVCKKQAWCSYVEEPADHDVSAGGEHCGIPMRPIGQAELRRIVKLNQRREEDGRC